MHRLTQTVNRSFSTGVLLGGFALALVIWFLAYTQAKVDGFSENMIVAMYTQE
jgi:uncharacterized membrane protein